MTKRRPRVNWDRARGIFGNPRPPKTVTEQQFDGFDEDLQRLAITSYEEMDFSDFWYYHHDLAYVDLQPDLFAYLFPACLMDWQQTLLANEACSHGDSEFHYGLRHGQVLEKMLTAEQRQEVYDFLGDGFLDRLDQERGFVYSGMGTPAYGWMYRLNSLGLIMPDIAPLWEAWWEIPSAGAAVAAIQYCSGLMYHEGENPLFSGWTKDGGGGGPYLWESDSNIQDSGWMPGNVTFLEQRLTSNFVESGLHRALAKLVGEPEEMTARRIVENLPSCGELVAKRVRELPEMLAAGGLILEWPP